MDPVEESNLTQDFDIPSNSLELCYFMGGDRIEVVIILEINLFFIPSQFQQFE